LVVYNLTFNIRYNRGVEILSKITNVGFHGKPHNGRSGGPRAQPGHQVVSIYFIFAFHETTKVSIFLVTFSWIPPKIQLIINEIQVPKIKKYEWFTMKSNIGDFGQNCSTSALAYIKVNLNTNNNYIQFTGLLINIMP